jgi:hypothetical protein
MSAIRTPADVPPLPPFQYTPSPAQERCLEAFARDLPELLRTHAGKWVAYINGERLRIADTQTELDRECLYDRGLPHEEFVVFYIYAGALEVIEIYDR